MLDLADLLTNILPYDVAFGLTLAFISAAIVMFVMRYRYRWTSLVGEDTLIIGRIFLLVFFAGLMLSTYISTQVDPTISDVLEFLASFWWVFLVYALFEFGLIIYRRQLRRTAGLPTEVLQEMYDTLSRRQDSSGGYRIGPDGKGPVELWCTAQTLHGFIVQFKDISVVPHVNGVLRYYQGLSEEGEVLWSASTDDFLIVPATWALISLEELTGRVAFATSLADGQYDQALRMIRTGIKRLIRFQLKRGGWAPVGRMEEDFRTFPTVLAVWALALALRYRSTIGFTKDDVSEIFDSLTDAIDFLMSVCEEDKVMWDSNPLRGYLRRNSGLTLITYSALSTSDRELSRLSEIAEAESYWRKLDRWLDANHKRIMHHIDYVVYRDIDDSETDGPYDHIVTADTSTTVPTTFYDWVPAALLAINASKLTGRYSIISDSLKEKRVTSLVLEHRSRFSDWYTYRLAVILAASQTTRH